MDGNDFPKLGINTRELLDAVNAALNEAREGKAGFGAVNWCDLGVVDVEYRLSMLHPDEGPRCVVLVEEASPDCKLGLWLTEKIGDRFPRVQVECEW